jgi:hypothetical protein
MPSPKRNIKIIGIKLTYRKGYDKNEIQILKCVLPKRGQQIRY